MIEKKFFYARFFVQANLASEIRNLVIIGYYAISYVFLLARLDSSVTPVLFIFFLLTAESLTAIS